MAAVISNHNRKILCPNPDVGISSRAKKDCNYRGGVQSCPLQGKCLTKSVIYKADMIVATRPHHILASPPTHSRRGTLTTSAPSTTRSTKRVLPSQYKSGRTKNKTRTFKLDGTIISAHPAFSPNSGTCHLCLMEKTLILTSNHPNPP